MWQRVLQICIIDGHCLCLILCSQVDMFSYRCYRFFSFFLCCFLYCLPFIGELKIIINNSRVSHKLLKWTNLYVGAVHLEAVFMPTHSLTAAEHNSCLHLDSILIALQHQTLISAMRVDLSPRLGGHTVANQPPTTVLLSFTFTLLPPPAERCKVSQQVWNRVMNWTWTCVSPHCDLLD